MRLMTRYVETKSWRPTTFKEEERYISSFWDIEEAKKRLNRKETLACSIKVYKLINGVV